MKKYIYILILVVASACPAFAQFTTVTATVKDPNGIPYAGAVLNAVLVPSTGGGYTLGGQPYSGRIGPVTLDVTGSFTVNFGDVTLITPGSPQWQITIDSAAATIGPSLGTGPQSFTFTSTGTTISGSSPVSLTTALNALAPKLTTITIGGNVTTTGGPLANMFAIFTGPASIGPASPCALLQPTSNPTVGQLLQSAAPSAGACQTSWVSASAGSGTVSGLAGQSAYFSAANAVTGGAGEIDMKGLSGADLGAIMNNCTGKICKGDNLTGSLTLSTAVTVPAGVTFHFCGQSISQSAAVTLSNGGGSVIGCPGASTTFTKAGNIDQFTMSATNTHIRGLTLAGAANSSFTGGGINAPTAGAGSDIEDNSISNEQTFGIKPSGSTLTMNNVVSASTSSTQAAITGGGRIVYNNCSTNGAIDCIDATSSTTVVDGNLVSIAPPASTSGLCGINVLGDVIGAQVTNNSTNDADSNSGNTNYGICLTTAIGSSHMYENNVEHNIFNGQVSGGASAIGYWLNNATSLATEFSENHFRDDTCTHETQCFKMTDSTGQPNYGDEFGFNAGGIIGSDTGFVLKQTTNSGTPGFTLAQINAFTVGPGSQIWCHDCQSGRPAITGGPGNLLTLNGSSVWVGTPINTWTFVQSAQASANASSVNITLTNAPLGGQGDLVVVGIKCNQAASPTLAVSDGTNGSYTSAIAVQAIMGSTSWGQIFYFPSASGGSAAKTIAVSSSGNACTNVDATAAEYYNTAPVSPEDGAGASAQGNSASLSSGNFTVTVGDLVVGFGVAPASGLCVGTGVGFTARSCTTSASLLEDSTAASTTVSATAGANSGNWAMLGVAFKRAP